MVLINTPQSAGASGWFSFRAFGHNLASNIALPGWQPQAAGSADLTLIFTSAPPFEWQPDQLQPDFVSRSKNQEGRSILSYYRLESCPVMRFLDLADFYIWPERVICFLQGEVPDYTLNILLFANVLPFWLELKGFVTLHGSAVSISGKIVAFIAHSRTGKSTLAAAFLQQGHALLTDDVLPLIRSAAGYLAYPGYPVMRMWPGEVEHFLSSYEGLERVHPEFNKRHVPLDLSGFGAFCDDSTPLERIYILERQEAADCTKGLEIRRVSPRDALVELLRYSFVGRLGDAAGLAPTRFAFLSELVESIPVRRLVYPGGYEFLPQVRQAVLADSSIT
jgi:hypothetical protein